MLTDIRGLIKGKTTMWIESVFDSKVTGLCEKILDIKAKINASI